MAVQGQFIWAGWVQGTQGSYFGGGSAGGGPAEPAGPKAAAVARKQKAYRLSVFNHVSCHGCCSSGHAWSARKKEAVSRQTSNLGAGHPQQGRLIRQPPDGSCLRRRASGRQWLPAVPPGCCPAAQGDLRGPRGQLRGEVRVHTRSKGGGLGASRKVRVGSGMQPNNTGDRQGRAEGM